MRKSEYKDARRPLLYESQCFCVQIEVQLGDQYLLKASSWVKINSSNSDIAGAGVVTVDVTFAKRSVWPSNAPEPGHGAWGAARLHLSIHHGYVRLIFTRATLSYSLPPRYLYTTEKSLPLHSGCSDAAS